MAGNKEGGRKAALRNLQNNPNFYSEIGRKGGSVATPTSGFGHPEIGADGLTGPERASIAGIKGGMISRRGSRKNVTG